MVIPNLPTDNLYKFLALSGLVLSIFSTYFGVENHLKLSNEIDKSSLEIKLINMDTVLYNHKSKEIDQKTYILLDYITEKYTNIKNLIHTDNYPDFIKSLYVLKADTVSDAKYIYNVIYSLALRKPELMPLYEEYKNLCDEAFNWSMESNKKLIEIKEKVRLQHKKSRTQVVLNILFSLLTSLGFYISGRGFINWYYRIQLYQDKVLENSVLNEQRSKESRTKK